MIKTVNETINGVCFTHAYSDDGHKIIQDGTGYVYDDAYDPAGSGRTYHESTEFIETKTTTPAEEMAKLKTQTAEQAKQIETTAQAVQDMIIQLMGGDQ